MIDGFALGESEWPLPEFRHDGTDESRRKYASKDIMSRQSKEFSVMGSINKLPGPDRWCRAAPGLMPPLPCPSWDGYTVASRESHLRAAASNIESTVYFCFVQERLARQGRTGHGRAGQGGQGQVASEANGMLGKSAEETHRLSACRGHSGYPDGRGLGISSICERRNRLVRATYSPESFQSRRRRGRDLIPIPVDQAMAKDQAPNNNHYKVSGAPTAPAGLPCPVPAGGESRRGAVLRTGLAWRKEQS